MRAFGTSAPKAGYANAHFENAISNGSDIYDPPRMPKAEPNQKQQAWVIVPEIGSTSDDTLRIRCD
jgi:hypothetical protein